LTRSDWISYTLLSETGSAASGEGMTMSKSRNRRTAAVLAIVVCVTTALGLPATAQAAGPDGRSTGRCTPGAPGIGDSYYPNYGNGGYEVRKYDLDLTYDPATDVLDGVAGIKANATKSLCSFNLDLVGMTVRSIKVDGARARWSRTEHELTVIPKHPIERGDRFKVEVKYGGVPHEFVLQIPPDFELRTGFMATPDGATVAGQPEVAAGWFPVNDHPLDKARYSFDIRVPRGYEVVANGFLTGRETKRGWTTYEWDAREPMASYLATIDIGFWDVHKWRTDTRLPVYDAVDSAITGGLRAAIDSSLARQGEVLDVLGGAFGPYPFSTVGAIVDNQDDLFFALETQTRPVYSKLFWLDAAGNPVNGDSVVVHELAHQWFGDKVALARWQDIWLNEGFATYAEWLWAEHEGQATPQEIFLATYEAIPADDPFWDVVIGDPTVELLFDNAIYVRGAMTLQALRNEVGDDDFWRIVRRWAAQRDGHGTTREFIALAERISGQQLDEFFDVWLFTGEKPASPNTAAAASRAAASADDKASDFAREWLAKTSERLERGRR
jgi:aminopeptidase N